MLHKSIMPINNAAQCWAVLQYNCLHCSRLSPRTSCACLAGLRAEALLLPRQWCGDAAGTTSNVKLMAECIARRPLTDKEVFRVDMTNVVGCYFPGVGLAGTADLPGFVEWLSNGATANDIMARCVEAYRFIVDHFTADSEVWLLGLSRGAFTVRSVAGMINNFGILDKDKPALEGKLDTFCDSVYRMYRSRDEKYKPKEPYPAEFKAKYCVSLHGRPPIKFMGLLDTVGSLGVPKVNAGLGLGYEFYDQNVSGEVQNVYQALAAHDRLFGFDPCFVHRQPGTNPGVTREVWFPGAHYDLGRQRFVPFRTTGGLVEKAAHAICDWTNILFVNIEPTLSCSVHPLKWLLRCMRLTDSDLLSDADIVAAERSCLREPLQDRIPFVPRALEKNAFDHMSTRFFRRFSPIFAGFALHDRQIPVYSDANFIGGENGANNELAFISPGSGFESKAYNTFKALRPSGITWVID